MLLKRKEYGLLDMITMSFRVSPFYSLIFALHRILNALLPTFSIFITANFLSAVIAVYNNEAEITSVYRPILYMMGIVAYNLINGNVMNFFDCRRSIFYRNKLIPEMYNKHARLEYRHIENPETADLVNRVSPPFDSNIWAMYIQVLNLLNLVVFIMGINITLISQVWWVGLTVLIVSGPLLYIATKAGKRSYDAEREMSKIDRRANYISDILKNREAIEERSIYDYTDYLNQQYGEKFEFSRKFKLKVLCSNTIKQKLGSIIATFYSVGLMLAMLPSVTRGDLEYGMFIALMIAVFELTRRLAWGINSLITDLTKKYEYLKDLTKFMRLDEHEEATAIPDRNISFDSIEFRNVSFRYPDTNKLILNGISFKIERGKKYSFVGVNGAGKTTIVKLITGLYTNYEGEILIDGRPLRDLTQSQIKGLSSVVYQDFAKYYISMYDNIALSDLDNFDNRKEVEKAAQLMGLNKVIAKLKDGLDTPLGRIVENSIDLSVGEWQRVAMARSVMSNTPLKILDEPTASLDPMAESMVYNDFERISKGTTTILISHRLGSTKLADVIFVISNGKVIEEGTHSSLINKKGTYCQMFNSQAEWYKNDIKEEVLNNVCNS